LNDGIEPTKERLAKVETRDTNGKVIDPGTEDFVSDSGKLTRRIQDTLDLLLSRSVITSDHWNAGRRLRADWEQARIDSIGVIDTTREAVDGGKFETMPDKQLDAMDRYDRAINGVGGEHKDALLYMVIHEEKTADYGFRTYGYKDRNQASVAGITRLKSALTDLDFYYYGRRSATTGAAHALGYRPTIQESTG
jgi:hypothetical protein